MPKKHNYTLTETEYKQVREAMKNLDGRISKRASIVHGLHLGHSPTELAQMNGLSLASIYNQFNRFKAEGFEGLADKPKSGRPRKATAAYIELLEETLEIDPKAKGYAFTMWTQARLRKYLAQETGIEISRSVFQELMQRLGYRYRRPKRDLSHKQDQDLREQVKQALDEVKKEPKQVKSSYSLWMKVQLD
ncbi:MAG: IS630 family transposase [Phototrophicaceae bacterium]